METDQSAHMIEKTKIYLDFFCFKFRFNDTFDIHQGASLNILWLKSSHHCTKVGGILQLQPNHNIRAA